MVSPATAARRALPSVDKLLKLDVTIKLIAEYGRPLVVEALRAILEEHRSASAENVCSPDASSWIALCVRRLRDLTRPSLRPVINLTGTVLHTNLGRALVSRSAADAAIAAMTRAVNLEYDLDSGARGERDNHALGCIQRLTGAEGVVIVNNNAAAVFLVLNTLALRGEVVVSRGELIEIGGAFRIPDIMTRSGCRLREIGTTNRTHVTDYVEAISGRTSAIMKVHTSNYAIQGFTSSVSEVELARIAHEHELPLVVDLGSGTLLDLEQFGLPHEPTPRDAIAHGADIVTFSGDKLLGGPQCGVIVGRKDLIARIRRNPIKRALRVDKVTLAALDATLRLYLNPERAVREVPTLRLLTRSREEIEAQVNRVLPAVAAAVAAFAEARLVHCASQIGSGALPVDALPSAGIALTPRVKRRGAAANALAAAFRALPVPVIGRVKDGACVLDLRCLDDDSEFVDQLQHLVPPPGAS